MRIDWGKVDRARERQNAYHEAGHAVVDFLCRAGWDIQHISMRGNAQSAARVRRQDCFDLKILLFDADTVTDANRDHYRRVAKREIIGMFAGPAAEWRVSEDRDIGWWFDSLSDRSESKELGDFDAALKLARKVSLSPNRASRMLLLMARWTDELLALPRVWHVVELLAAKLKHGRVISGDRACKIMEAGWGSDTFNAPRLLDRLWQDRLGTRLHRVTGDDAEDIEF